MTRMNVANDMKSGDRDQKSRLSPLPSVLLFTMLLLLTWSAQALAVAVDGMVLYSNATTTPQRRVYSNATNTFAAAGATVLGAAPTFIVNKQAPTRNERIAGYVTTGGVLYIYRWDGSTWINETAAAGGWGGTVTVGGNGLDGRRFDIAYESTTGRAMVVYSRNVATTNELAYRIWNGATWTAATTLDSARITGIATAVKLLSRPTTGSNEIALTVCGLGGALVNTAQLSTLIWSGAAWGNEPAAAHSLAVPSVVTTGLVQNDLFDMAYEGLSGDLMVVFSLIATQCYRTYSVGTWGAVVNTLNTRAPPLQMIAVGNPYSDEILVAYNRSASSNVYGHIWSGSLMPAATTIAATGLNPTAIEKKHITGNWVRSGTTDAAVVVNATAAATAQAVSYSVYTAGAWVAVTSWASGVTVTSTNAAWMDLVADPDKTNNSNELMLFFTDNQLDLWAKRLIFTAPNTFTWSNADGGTALFNNLTAVTSRNFSFSYDRVADVTAPVEVALTVTPTSGSYTAGTFTISETFTEAESNVNTCEYTLDGSVWTAGVVSGAKPTFTCTATGVTAADGTSLNIQMRAVSKGGTSTVANTAVRTVDATAPATSDNYPGGSVSVDQSLTLTVSDGTGSGVASTLYCQDATNTCSPVTSGLGPISITGTAGAKTVKYLRYASTDNVSNAETVKSTTVTIDKRNLTETVALVFSNVDHQSLTVTAQFGGDANANNSCVITYGTDGVTYPNATTETKVGNTYVADVAGLGGGITYYFRAQFADADTVTGTNPLLANQKTTKLQLLHSSAVTGTKYPAWGAAYTCATCHARESTNVKRIATVVGGAGLTNAAGVVVSGNALSATIATGATTNFADNAITNKVCDACHSSTTIYKRGVANVTSGTPAMITGASPPHPADPDCVKCHEHRKGFKVNAGCRDCHALGGTYQVATSAKIIVDPAGAALRGETYGGHLKAIKTETFSLSTDWDAQCLKCHDGHENTDGVNILNNTDVGINYLSGYISLGGSATSGSTEAEICWNCHDLAANAVSEWGVNTDTNGTGNNYNFGAVYTSAAKTTTTSRWIGSYWTSANFTYKEGWLNNKPNTTNSVTGTANGGSTHAAQAGVQGIDAVANIRCSYCHDVHNTAALTAGFLGAANDPNGKPYLRGRWVGSPYKEDGAPRSGQAGTYPAMNTTTNPWGPVPRGSAAMGTVMGGYWIDQNSADPIAATYTATQFGGLCDLCHGTTKNGTLLAAEIDALNTYGTAGAGWVSALNGHSNSVDEGTDTTTYIAARNIFAGRGGANTQTAQNTADHPYMLFQGTTLPGDASGGFRAGDSAWAYLPAMSARPTDGDGWVNTGWNNLAGRTLDLDGGTVVGDINANFHSFSCSKCHTPHASRLPALMITNCLDTKNNTWDNDFQVHGTTDTINAGRSISNWSSAQNCHRVGGNDPSDTRDTAANAAGGNQGWNTITPW